MLDALKGIFINNGRRKRQLKKIVLPDPRLINYKINKTMAKHELTDINARLKGHSILLTAADADGESRTITVPCEDIREIYGQSCPQWMDENGDRESSLWELWQAVAGITISEI